MKLAENLQEMLTYIKYNVEGRKEASIILSSDILMELIDELKTYGRTLTSFSCEIDNESEIYLITKYLNEINKECLMIEPLIQYNEEIEDFEYVYVKDDFVLIEEYSLDEEEIEDIIKTDDFEIIGLIEDHPELEEDEDCDCSTCQDFECEHNCNFKDETDDIVEVYTQMIQDTHGCPGCISEILKELIEVVYDMGYESGLLEEE